MLSLPGQHENKDKSLNIAKVLIHIYIKFIPIFSFNLTKKFVNNLGH